MFLFTNYSFTIMKYKLISLFAALLLAGAFFVSCKQEPLSSNGTNSMPMYSSSHPAHPAITYWTAASQNGSLYWSIGVMDTDATNQTLIKTSPANESWLWPSWSPAGGSIAWIANKWTSARTYGIAIKALDVSVNSQGKPVASNLRTIISLPSNTSFSDGIGPEVAWSSTSTTNQIAYTTVGPDNGDPNYELYVVSASGGTATEIYESDTSDWHHKVALANPTWNADDSRLAVVRYDSTSSGSHYSTIMIFNTSTWAYVDSISIVAASIPEYLEWSRTGLNKLAFGMSNGSSIVLYYCTASSGSTPATDGVSYRPAGPTWSPNNSSIMYFTSSLALNKVVPFTTTTTQVASSITGGAGGIRWKR
jgi:hypothetical protein